MIDAAKIEELLSRAEALQRQINDLEGLLRVVIEPVANVAYGYDPSCEISDEQLRRFQALWMEARVRGFFAHNDKPEDPK